MGEQKEYQLAHRNQPLNLYKLVLKIDLTFHEHICDIKHHHMRALLSSFSYTYAIFRWILLVWYRVTWFYSGHTWEHALVSSGTGILDDHQEYVPYKIDQFIKYNGLDTSHFSYYHRNNRVLNLKRDGVEKMREPLVEWKDIRIDVWKKILTYVSGCFWCYTIIVVEELRSAPLF